MYKDRYRQLAESFTVYFIFGKDSTLANINSKIDNEFEFTVKTEEAIKLEKEIMGENYSEDGYGLAEVLHTVFQQNRGRFEYERDSILKVLPTFLKLKE